MRARSLQRILGEARGRLGRLERQARLLRHVDQRLAAALPEPLRDHVHVACLSPERILLWVDSPAWHSRLRFLKPQLEKILESECGLKVGRIESRIMLDIQQQNNKRRPATLSKQAVDTLERAAASMDDDKLACALRKLARHGRAKEP